MARSLVTGYILSDWLIAIVHTTFFISASSASFGILFIMWIPVKMNDP